MSARVSLCEHEPITGSIAQLATAGLCNAICVECNIGDTDGTRIDLGTIKVDGDNIKALSKDKIPIDYSEWKLCMSANNCGHHFETLHFRYFVKCELCDRWRLRKRSDIFYSCRALPPVINMPDWNIRAKGKDDD